MRCNKTVLLTVCIFSLVLLQSCSSYMTEQGGFFSKFNRGQFKEAADMLKEKSEKEGKDQILFLLDRGAALFEARDYKNAIEILTKAERREIIHPIKKRRIQRIQ